MEPPLAYPHTVMVCGVCRMGLAPMPDESPPKHTNQKVTMSTVTATPSDTITHGHRSITVDRVLPSGRKERWVFEACDTLGTNGLDIRSPRPHHFPMHLWAEVQYLRSIHPQVHPASEGLQWVKTREGFFRLLMASADPSNY